MFHFATTRDCRKPVKRVGFISSLNKTIQIMKALLRVWGVVAFVFAISMAMATPFQDFININGVVFGVPERGPACGTFFIGPMCTADGSPVYDTVQGASMQDVIDIKRREF